jgi:Mg-chelatase subunit ChlD
MNSLNDFLIQKPRPLPVIVAVDRSGSMCSSGKVDALNIALKDFIIH